MLKTRSNKKKIESLSSSSSSSSEKNNFEELEKTMIGNIINNFLEEKQIINNNEEVIKKTSYIKNDIPHEIIITKNLNNNTHNNMNNMNNMNNNINNIIIKKKNIEYDNIQNKYIIHEQQEIKTILLTDIINSILNAESNDEIIKKYLFIISFNSISNQYEYNFMPSILTDNLDMLIELENSIYTIINNDDFEKRELKHKMNLILFFYQIIMFIYKKSFDYPDKNKLQTIYNTLSYRFSLIILKQIYNLKDELKYLNTNYKESLEIKNKLESKIFDRNNGIVESDNISNLNTSIHYEPSFKGGNITVNNDLSSVHSSSLDSDSFDSDDTDDNSYNSSSASKNASFYEYDAD
jgi:hypothetical protein